MALKHNSRGRPIGAKNKRPKYLKTKLSALKNLFTDDNYILVHPMYYGLLQEQDKAESSFILKNTEIPISHQKDIAAFTTSNKFAVII